MGNCKRRGSQNEARGQEDLLDHEVVLFCTAYGALCCHLAIGCSENEKVPGNRADFDQYMASIRKPVAPKKNEKRSTK